MARSLVVNLNRFWLPAGKSYSLTPSGWLSNPESTDLWRPNAEAISTHDLADRPCVVLLGEPGMGKTSALAVDHGVRPQGMQELHVDLGVYASEERLVRSVFECDRVTAWQAGSDSLCLTLDGFDEALNRVETFDRLLGEYLSGWECGRLYIRLVCRTADWPPALQGVLQDHFGDANVHELLPLRRSDATLLLRAAGLDAEQVLTAVEQARIVPLAARPLTLKLIQSSIGPDGTFPATARDLYERGLTALLDEMNPGRRGSIRPPGAVARRMQAAQRIAAQSLFGGRSTVWTGPVAEAVADDLTVDECVPAHGHHNLRITSHDVDAALRSGLFTGAGKGRLTWSHATFADFLGARWILDNGLSHEQVSSLIVANDGRIYARLRQVAAWLVGLAPNMFHALIERDPEAFLLSVDIPDDTLRAEIVIALLRDAMSGELFDQYETDYSGLRHSGLAEQLRPFLQAGEGNVCRVAVRIARDCSTSECVPDLIALALNESIERPLRTLAAMTVHDLCAGSPTRELVTLIRPGAGPSPDLDTQELEAAALMASWPHAISTEDVFSVLAPAHPRNYYGLYSIFVNRFAQGLEPKDLEPACAWMLADISRLDDSRLTTLTSAIVRLCIFNLDRGRAGEVVTAVAFRRLEEYQPPFGEAEHSGDQVNLDVNTRRALITVLLRTALEEQVFQIIHHLPGRAGELVRDEELSWLVEVYGASRGAMKVNAGRAALALYKPDLVSHSSIVLGLSDDHPAAELFAYWRSPISLDSEAAISARGQWREHAGRLQELSRRREGERGADGWVNPRIAEEIEKAASGTTSAFWHAASLVTVRPGTQRYMDEHQPDLTLHPRWETLSEAVRSEFVSAARKYLETGECQPGRWLAQDLIYRPARAGYQALVLLLRLWPSALADISPAAWREWAPILIAWTATINGANEEDKRRLLALARPHANEQMVRTMLTLVDKAITAEAYVFLRTEFDVLSSEPLAHELIDRLARPMAHATQRTILDFLVERHASLVAPALRSWLEKDARTDDPVRARDAVCRLLQHDADRSWSDLRALMHDDAPFMCSALLAGAQAFDRRAPDLAPQDLANLYLWLCEYFPPDEDPKDDEVHAVGPRESVGNWRDALLNALSGMGTREAVSAIEGIASARPGASWLARVVAEAKRTLRERSWERLSPDEIDQLANSRRGRVVRSDADLLEAAMVALDEIQARLQADTPSSYLLWDTHAGRPKTEEEISDYLAIEMEQRLNARGIVVNREVQVRRNMPSGLAERTDLRIESIPPDHADSTRTLRIPGEVKGIWNPNLVESLETQLVHRYMSDFQTDYGVYIVAWFDQASWKTSDGRRGRAASHGSVSAIRAALEVEATKQRDNGRVVSVCVLDCSLKRPVMT